MSSNAGGAATNAGIDFQQRISAIFMTHMLMDVAFIDDLGMTKSAKIQSLQFESNEAVDDLVVQTTLGTVYIQAKRSISCSMVITSEFSKVIKQFVAQYSNGVSENDKFVLATTSKASSKITRSLKKIIESIKLNDASFIKNPLNKSEKSVYDITMQLIGCHYRLIHEKEVTEEVRLNILKKMHVSVLDIEAGMPLEKAVITLISSNATISAELVWSSLIILGLSLSKDRMSINKKGLEERVGDFFKESTTEDDYKTKENLLKIEIKDNISSVKEVLIIESFDKNYDYLIIELRRFDEGGKKRLKFYQNKVELPDGHVWGLIFRASSFLGIERYIENNEKVFKEKRVGVLEGDSEEQLDETPISLGYSELCQKMFNEKTDHFICIHCGDPISDDQSPHIELDAQGVEHDVGFVHNECLIPTDRILGLMDAVLFRENPHLINFDHKAWYVAAAKGQGLFSGLSNLPKDIYPVAWKPDYNNISRGKYCIKINLEDGSSRYVHDRGRVVRETQSEAEEKCIIFNSMFKESKSKKDSICYTSNAEFFATYSVAMQKKAKDEDCLICVNAEVVAFTHAINKAYSQYDSYYAPLIIFLDRESGLPIVIDEAMLMLSSPLELERYLINWKRAGLELPPYTLSIIDTDAAFDKLVSDFMSDGVSIIIDPELDMKGQMTSGVVIESMYEIANTLQTVAD